MNIFATSECPIQSAKEHCDRHIVKMVTEAAQILPTAHYVLDGKIVGFDPTHINHPCSVWARKTSANYLWLWQHYVALSNEYTRRFGRKHAGGRHINELSVLPENIVHANLTFFAKAMPEQFKRIPNAQEAYKAYLNVKFKDWLWRTDKRRMKVEWTNSFVPEWVDLSIFIEEAA